MDDSGPPRSSKADGVPGSVRSRRTRTRNAQQGNLYQDQSRGRVRDSRTRPLLLTSRPDDGPVGESGPGLRHAATGGFDLALGRRGHLVDGHGDGDREVPVPQHLDGLALADRTGGHELGHADLAALREKPLDVGHVDDLEHDLVPILEALELRQPHLERHLAALEAGRDVLPGLGALGTATGGLALGRLATTHAGLLGVRPGRGPQVVQRDAHVVTSVSSTTTRWLTTLRRPRVCALSSRPTDFRMPLSPSVRRESRWFFFDPMVPRTWVIFRFAMI